MNLRGAHNFLLTMLLVFGILGPKIATVVSLSIAQPGQTIVICTGDGLQEITLDNDGKPVSSGKVLSDLCVQANTDRVDYAAIWNITRINRLIIATLVLPEQSTPVFDRITRLTPVRAPPVI